MAYGAANPRARLLALFGELLVTLGLIMGLFVAYELWWTNITAGRQTSVDSRALLRQWQTGRPATPTDSIATGQSFGFLYIPAFGVGWRALIMQGIDRYKELNTGVVGHYDYPGAAYPWDPTGNFAVAGHRDGHGMIFRDLNQLKTGDRVYVQSQYGWYVYQLDREASAVSPKDTGAVAAIPTGSGYAEPGRYITLTTCTPIYLDTSRMVWWGHFIEQTSPDVVPSGVTPDAA
jgi:sortase A